MPTNSSLIIIMAQPSILWAATDITHATKVSLLPTTTEARLDLVAHFVSAHRFFARREAIYIKSAYYILETSRVPIRSTIALQQTRSETIPLCARTEVAHLRLLGIILSVFFFPDTNQYRHNHRRYRIELILVQISLAISRQDFGLLSTIARRDKYRVLQRHH